MTENRINFSDAVLAWRAWVSEDEPTFLQLAAKISLYPEKMTNLMVLMYCSGCTEGVRLLVRNFGADPHAIDAASRRTPLMYACTKKHLDMVKFHVQHFRSNLDKTRVDLSGYSASMHGLSSVEITKFLIAEGLFEPSLETGWCMHDHFQVAVLSGFFETAKLIVDYVYQDRTLRSKKTNRLYSEVMELNGPRMRPLQVSIVEQLDFIHHIGRSIDKGKKPSDAIAMESAMGILLEKDGVLMNDDPFLWMVERGFAVELCEIQHCGKSTLYRDYMAHYFDPRLFILALEKKRGINDAVNCFDQIFENRTKRSSTITRELVRVFAGASKTLEQEGNITSFYIFLRQLQRRWR